MAHNDIRKSAEQYLEFISRIVDARPEDALIDDIATELGALGIDATAHESALVQIAGDVSPLAGNLAQARVLKNPAIVGSEIAETLHTEARVHQNGRLRKLDGVDYKQAAIEYVSKLDAERRHYLFTKPFYNLANKPNKHAGEGMDAETFRHFCDFANIAVALALPAESRILDVGCGSGWLSEYFARLEKQRMGINLATYVGATQVRRMVLGDADVVEQTGAVKISHIIINGGLQGQARIVGFARLDADIRANQVIADGRRTNVLDFDASDFNGRLGAGVGEQGEKED